MSELIVYRGNGRVTVKPTSDVCYLYRIGSGYVEGGKFVELNDGQQLNSIAEEVRDDYVRWVYSLNDSFLEADLVIDNLSLFFLTDLSCKRSEFFETFDLICSLLLIQRQLPSDELTHAHLIGCESGFERAFRSIYPITKVTVSASAKARTNPWRRLGADSLYLVRVVGVLIANAIMKKNTLQNHFSGRVFFSIYPQMFSNKDIDTKYGEFPNNNDNYAISILSDGMHQKTSVSDYVRWCREAQQKGFGVIDRYLAGADLALGIFWSVRMWQMFLRQTYEGCIFKSINISGLIRTEFLFSISRVMRLIILKESLRRFLQAQSVKELVYYPCEYPLGRMISWIVSVSKPGLVRTGFQMSIVSERRLEQFLAPGEGSTQPPFLKHAPLPDRVLAEDEDSARIYRQSGYRNVEIMDTIYRYGYLNNIIPAKRPGWLLIAPGLHDGALMLEELRSEIAGHPNNRYLVKPHPRANNDYLVGWSSTANLQVSTQAIEKLLAIVSRVFVTYSSVGIEAKKLGLAVTVINVPGRVNPSPLLVL